jgi:argininosuccinate lyase
MLMIHLSKFAEDLIIFGTAEFGFVHFADAYSTGSSLMPQKKNPDALELLRGKTARVIGNHSTLLTMMKGLPTAYNKDMQEDKRALFDTAATTRAALQIAAGVLSTLTISRERMQAALSAPLLATDLSDYLVRKGMPFREAHHVVGSAVKLAETKKCELNELTDADYKTLSALFAKDVGEVWDFEKAVERRDETGGTSKRAVLEQVTRMQTFVAKELSKKK